VIEVINAESWRMRRMSMMTAWFTASLTNGTEGLPSLADLLKDPDEDDAAAPGAISADEYHRRMRELGLE
jgi:hypothetical protein